MVYRNSGYIYKKIGGIYDVLKANDIEVGLPPNSTSIMKITFCNLFKSAGILLLFFLSACNKDEAVLTFGEEWTNTSTKVFAIDTLTVKTSSFKFDSISVSGAGRFLVGAYHDPVFGFLNSEAYLQFSPAEYTIDSEAEYDSIALILKYDGYFYSDTLQSQKFLISEVLEDIEPEKNYFYNTTTFQTSEEIIGKKSFHARLSQDSMSITLNKAYGREIFERIQEKSITSLDEYLRKFKGLLIAGDSTNSSILGFSTESLVRVYYNIDGETEGEQGTLDLNLVPANSFHHVSSNFSNTWFDALEDQETYLESSGTNDQVFIQSGTGIATRIDIPYLENLNDIEGSGTIMDANLIISLYKSPLESNFATRDSLQLYIINQHSEILSQVTDYSSNAVQGLIAERNDEFNLVTYSFPLKYYLDLKRTDFNGDNWYLAVFPQDFASSVDRYVFYGEHAAHSRKMKLQITYALYDE